MGDEDASLVYESFLPVAPSYADAVEEGDAAQLCNIDFSLAYGGKILLHNTRLRLLAGHRCVRACVRSCLPTVCPRCPQGSYYFGATGSVPMSQRREVMLL